MCGIAGFITREGMRPDESVVRRMCTRIAHRGPDAPGLGTCGPDASGPGGRAP